MKALDLDDLPHYTPWVARLLGEEPWPRSFRTLERAIAEYEEKHRFLLDMARANPGMTASDLRVRELGDWQGGRAVVLRDDLFVSTLGFASNLQTNLTTNVVRRWSEGSRTIVDLGCGWGWQMTALHEALKDVISGPLKDVRILGGEVTASGVVLARRLGLEVYDFNLLAGGADPLLHADPPITVLTSYALHQLPSAAGAIRRLGEYRERIGVVVNVEPVAEYQGDGLLGMLRRRYEWLCDYSSDVLTYLRARDDVEVLEVTPNVVGVNALLPASHVVWRFR